MKDIGSIFPLYDGDMNTNIVLDESFSDDNITYYSLCREALYVIANDFPEESRIVMLPAYTCSTVVEPFEASGWKCLYYPVDKSLRLDVNSIKSLYGNNSVSLILVHPYFGVELNEEENEVLEFLHGRGCKVIVDLTQCIFSNKKCEFADYIVGSFRKWYEVPDGGFLKTNIKSHDCNSKLAENEDFVSLQKDSMYLRGLYFNTGNEEIKNISRRLNKRAVDLIKNTLGPHAMSQYSMSLMKRINIGECQSKRIENYNYLFQNLKDHRCLQLACNNPNEVTTAPLYFVIYIKDRAALQSSLATEHIYAPVIWPVPCSDVLVNETIKSIYDTVLAIPVDQRYDLSDMKKIVETINKHYHE